MRHPALLATLAAGAALAAGSTADAGCSSGCTACCLPANHTIYIPGPGVAIPGVVAGSVAGAGGGGGGVGGSGGFDLSVSVQNSAQASGVGQSYAAAVGNAQAANLLAASGGAGGVVVEQGGGSSVSINNLTVVGGGVTPAPTQEICNAWASVSKAMAVQATCIDDKAVPHPASQLSPDRDVAGGYVGELFRCIAGTHMQYVTAEWSGQARFDHGQTVVCEKGESLWRDVTGRLQCKAQTPARDCNERSLLRRFGAGIKVMQASARMCTSYGPGPVTQAAASSGVSVGDFSGDGGVGR